MRFCRVVSIHFKIAHIQLLIIHSHAFHIHVFSDKPVWSTSETGLDPARLEEFVRGETKPGDSPYKLIRYKDELILQARDGVYDIYFQVHDVGSLSRSNHLIFIVVALVLGVLVLMYCATRAIFRPFEDIKHGVRQFGEGNFEHRIFKRRNDELGDLTDDINQMAEDINNMLEAKRQFLLGISHELRSPLTRCQVNLALMEKSVFRNEISREIVAMDELINELLESERLNSPHRVIRPEYLDLHTLIQEVIDQEFSTEDLIVELSPASAEVDPARIKLLVRNLVQNAIKYNGPGTPVKITLEKSKGKLRFVVRDYGEGIAPEFVPLLTEPFYRADATGRSKTGGYGLGLYLCRMIVQAHSGKMDIQSKPGKGTRISCIFPLPENEALSPA